jgi:hypothetical protein
MEKTHQQNCTKEGKFVITWQKIGSRKHRECLRQIHWRRITKKWHTRTFKEGKKFYWKSKILNQKQNSVKNGRALL